MEIAKATGRYHHGDLKQALLEIALALVERDGVQAVTMRGVARSAGVSEPAVYRHYPDKEALLAAVAALGFHDFTSALREARLRGSDPLAGLEAQGLAYVQFARDRPAQFRLMFGQYVDRGGRPELETASGGAFNELVESIRACQLAHLVRPIDAYEAAMAAWSLAHGMASLILDGQQIPEDRELTERVLNSLVVGLRSV